MCESHLQAHGVEEGDLLRHKFTCRRCQTNKISFSGVMTVSVNMEITFSDLRKAFIVIAQGSVVAKMVR